MEEKNIPVYFQEGQNLTLAYVTPSEFARLQNQYGAVPEKPIGKSKGMRKKQKDMNDIDEEETNAPPSSNPRRRERNQNQKPKPSSNPSSNPNSDAPLNSSENQISSNDQSSSSSLNASSAPPSSNQRRRERNQNQKPKPSSNPSSNPNPSQPQFSAFSRIPSNPAIPSKPLSSSSTSSSKPLKNFNPFATTQGYTELCESISSKMIANTYECLICYEAITAKQAIWACSSSCYACFHLSCIKKWAVQEKSTEATASNTNSSSSAFRCPGCQFVYTTGKPTQYLCFCGKTEDPLFNPYLIPHSCGNVCGRVRPAPSPCTHACTMLCHPGSCPPCSHMRSISCFCEKKEYHVRCSDTDSTAKKSCGQTCDKLLNCGQHKCQSKCHSGSCENCTFKYEQQCYCGKVVEPTRACLPLTLHEGNRTFCCGQACGKPLDCGNHTCPSKCHLGPCKPCALTPEQVKMCACGKTSIESLSKSLPPRTSCLDPVPTCDRVCNKTLPCGRHKCQLKCHLGPCGVCPESSLVTVPCRCTKNTVKVPCFVTYWKQPEVFSSLPADVVKKLEPIAAKYPKAPFSCDKVCNSFKSCGRHICKNRCCPSACVPYYDDPLHTHICRKNCGRPLECGTHRCDLPCHQGPCPPCAINIMTPIACPCGKTVLRPPQHCGVKLPPCHFECSIPRACGHPANHTCHPADVSCPPCQQIVNKMCAGGHEMVSGVPCASQYVSCSRTCGKLLSCGIHTCTRQCHDGECQKNTVNADDSCGATCNQVMSCGHFCKAVCHPQSFRDHPPCNAKVTVSCPCQVNFRSVDCKSVKDMIMEAHKKGKYDRDLATLGEIEKGVLDMQHLPPVLECDENCKRAKRNEMLADALQLNQQEKAMEPKRFAEFSEYILAFTLVDFTFVKSIETAFEKLLQSKQVIHFPPMSGSKRRAIHELAKSYGFDTRSVDRKPNRSVEVFYREGAFVPRPLLSVFILSQEAINSARESAEYFELSGDTKSHSDDEETERITRRMEDFNIPGAMAVVKGKKMDGDFTVVEKRK